ncbi:MAG: LysR family transcriptional regulator [Rhodomicrobium sp.]|nr:LysR family transcriptional regulator [Rhodomicrobium sp.]
MTLEQLRIFVAVAERQHMTQAARAINITQSAASSAIAALEARYATRLFHRIGRRIELTEAGRLFLAEARAVLARAASAERVLNDLSGCVSGSLSLHASQTIANYWLPPVMHRFHQAFPGVHLHLTIGNSEQVAAAVRDGIADIGFVEGGIGSDPALSSRAIEGDELVLVAGAQHPLAKQSGVKLEDLWRASWVLREPGSGTRAVFEEALRTLGAKPDDLQVSLDLPSNEAVRAAVEAGAGVTAISNLVAGPGLEAGTLRAIPLPLPKRRFLVLRHKERTPSRAEQAFLDMIEDQSNIQIETTNIINWTD